MPSGLTQLPAALRFCFGHSMQLSCTAKPVNATLTGWRPCFKLCRFSKLPNYTNRCEILKQKMLRSISLRCSSLPLLVRSCVRVRCVSYVQGQSPSPKTREYFYYIDHQGQVSPNVLVCHIKHKIFYRYVYSYSSFLTMQGWRISSLVSKVR